MYKGLDAMPVCLCVLLREIRNGDDVNSHEPSECLIKNLYKNDVARVKLDGLYLVTHAVRMLHPQQQSSAVRCGSRMGMFRVFPPLVTL